MYCETRIDDIAIVCACARKPANAPERVFNIDHRVLRVRCPGSLCFYKGGVGEQLA